MFVVMRPSKQRSGPRVIWTHKTPIGVPRSRHEGRLSGVGTMGEKSVTSEPYAFQKAHFTVIQQLHLITPFLNENK
jgi:hypothetical protein